MDFTRQGVLRQGPSLLRRGNQNFGEGGIYSFKKKNTFNILIFILSWKKKSSIRDFCFHHDGETCTGFVAFTADSKNTDGTIVFRNWLMGNTGL